jgi:hypothetical protein
MPVNKRSATPRQVGCRALIADLHRGAGHTRSIASVPQSGATSPQEIRCVTKSGWKRYIYRALLPRYLSEMILHTRVALGVLVTSLLVACGSPAEPTVISTVPRTLVLVSPNAIRVGDAFSISPDTIVLQVLDSTGRPPTSTVHGVMSDSTTGWLRQVGTLEWRKWQSFITDSLGRLRLLWQAGGSGPQRLTLRFSNYASLQMRIGTLSRSGVLLRADTVVSSGIDAVCIQQGGRVGCIGQGLCTSCADSVTTDYATGRIHWLRFTAPVATLTNTIVGACALLNDGNTACWDGLGPDNVAVNDPGHPPFVAMRQLVGLTADGVVWVSPQAFLGYPVALRFSQRRWLRMPSDSVIVELFESHSESVICGVTQSAAVMCGKVRQSQSSTEIRTVKLELVQDGIDGSVVRASGGITMYTALNSGSDRIVLWRTNGTSVRFTRSVVDSTAWRERAESDTSLSGPDPRVRACVPELGACGSTEPWRSVSVSGRFFIASSASAGFARVCGVREIVVCNTFELRGRLQASIRATDTIRLRP